ncbi:hypothetical protein ACLBKU_07090 [Erythrobacter sp. NE805]|uniref:hypothetical protein n=1 Tax=Erythrobacter sp. NE805 TaxID=3389875 RepID=UPI00396B1284
MRLPARALLALGTLALAACAGSGGGRPKIPETVIDRVLARAPGAAQPSTIVAAELAFSRAARERGQWTAFREFAAPGAMLHGPQGPFAVLPWLATQTDPPEAVQWAPRVIAMSCDGATAVSKGRFRAPDGTVGSFVTVWERQPDGAYRYVFDVGADDNPQPPPKERIAEGDIIVTAIDLVEGLIASCPRPGAPVPPPPALPIGADGTEGATLSKDGTLRWRWQHRADGTRVIAADYFYEGRWTTPIEQSLAPALK